MWEKKGARAAAAISRPAGPSLQLCVALAPFSSRSIYALSLDSERERARRSWGDVKSAEWIFRQIYAHNFWGLGQAIRGACGEHVRRRRGSEYALNFIRIRAAFLSDKGDDFTGASFG